VTSLISWQDTSDRVNETIYCAMAQFLFGPGLWVPGTAA